MKRYFLFALLTARAIFADPFSGHQFAFDLSEKVRGEEKNWVFSPFSISACLSMVAAGADGKTADEMRAVLELPKAPEEIGPAFELKMDALKHKPSSETDFQLNIAQGVWIKEDFSMLPSYASLLARSFHAIAERVRFNPYTAARINAWIAGETEQKILNLIPASALTEDTRLVLANALYFRGSWVRPFLSENTAMRPFRLSSDAKVQTATMSQTASFPYFEDESLQAVALPFACARDCAAEPLCLLVLPKEGKRFDSESLTGILDSLNIVRVKVQVPKFKIEQAILLNEPLKALGMKAVFSGAADLSKIDGLRDLFLSLVLHKSFFEFDEKGVEAAAATAAIINVTTALPRPTAAASFIADRPFYFLLLDKKSETILFLGQVLNPQS